VNPHPEADFTIITKEAEEVPPSQASSDANVETASSETDVRVASFESEGFVTAAESDRSESSPRDNSEFSDVTATESDGVKDATLDVTPTVSDDGKDSMLEGSDDDNDATPKTEPAYERVEVYTKSSTSLSSELNQEVSTKVVEQNVSSVEQMSPPASVQTLQESTYSSLTSFEHIGDSSMISFEHIQTPPASLEKTSTEDSTNVQTSNGTSEVPDRDKISTFAEQVIESGASSMVADAIVQHIVENVFVETSKGSDVSSDILSSLNRPEIRVTNFEFHCMKYQKKAFCQKKKC
jgi:hypothetical protein